MSQIDILFLVSTARSAEILRGFAEACDRSQCQWSIFLTNDAVQLTASNWFQAVTASATEVVACHDSWSRYTATETQAIDSPGNCPVTLGSQTNNSEMIGNATRVVSL